MKNLLSRLFLNDEGKVSWTAVLVLHGILLFWVAFFQLYIFGFEYSAALLTFTLELIIAFVAGRPIQRGLTGFINGVGSINKKGSDVKSADKITPTTPDIPEVEVPTQLGHFKIEEFNSKDGAEMPPIVKQNITRLIQNLEVIRAQLGGHPITITSGYRSPSHNASQPGASKNSYHMQGMAADFSVSGMSPREVAIAVKKMMEDGLIDEGGLKAYDRWVHYDFRGDFVTWGNNPYYKAG